jgi:integrase
MDALIDDTERDLAAARPDRTATFADAVAAWREYAEHTKRLKPATLRNYDAILSLPGPRPRHGGERLARVMRTFGDRRLTEITTAEIERFLRGLDRAGLAARNVNSHRQALANVFEYACRPDTFALPANPARGVEKRREDYTKPPDTFNAEQILALAQAAREGLHVNGGRRWASARRDVEQERANAQDAAVYTVAGFTGLRQGELRALRWKHVRFADRTIVVVAGMSAGADSSTKSGKWRAVPLPREAFVVLDELSRREWFTSPEDYVFCGPAGGTLDDSALRRRYNAARDAAGLPPLPFHHLRHTFATLAIRGLDPATVQSLLGHSKITTTERYLHARPLTELAPADGLDFRSECEPARGARPVSVLIRYGAAWAAANRRRRDPLLLRAASPPSRASPGPRRGDRRREHRHDRGAASAVAAGLRTRVDGRPGRSVALRPQGPAVEAAVARSQPALAPLRLGRADG